MIQVNKIGISEAEKLSALARRIYADHYLHLWEDNGEWYMNKCFTAKQLEIEMQEVDNQFFIVELEGFAVGFMKVRLSGCIEDRVGNGLEIERIYLAKEATGKGVGATLIDNVISIAQTLQKNYVWLKAMDSSGSAIRFYEKMGFQLSGTSRLDFPLMKPELRGMVTMVLAL